MAVSTPDAIPHAKVILARRKCMGTECEIKIFHHDEAAARRAFDAAYAALDHVEELMSDWRADSEVSRINAAAGKDAVAVSPETFEVIKESIAIARLTDGAFDITVGAFRGLWRFDEDKDGGLPKPAEVKKRLALVDHRDILLDEGARTVKLRRRGQSLNLGGVAKGFGVDRAVAAIRATGLRDFIVHAGGDLFASGRHGDRQWRVGVQDPRGERGRVIFQLAVEDRAFNTSGDYERFIMKDGKRYHHILDARTGFPVEGTRSVTLLARSAFTADLLDTALFTLGADRALRLINERDDLEGVIIDSQNRVFISNGLGTLLQKTADPTDGP
jgi:thiamine biosynthesis lipoprotein